MKKWTRIILRIIGIFLILAGCWGALSRESPKGRTKQILQMIQRPRTGPRG
jgi:hypothetical protein